MEIRQSQRRPIQRYDFEVLKGDETISAERSVWLSNSGDAWPKVAELAEKFNARGCRIRVTDQSGETVILIGASGVRSTLRRAEALATKDWL